MSDPQKLVSAYLDDALTNAERGELAVWLKTHPDHLRAFVEANLFEQQIRGAIRGQVQRQAADDFVEARQWPQERTERVVEKRARAWLDRRWPRLAALAASLALVATIGSWLRPPASRPPSFHLVAVGGEVWVQRGEVKRRATTSTTVLPGDRVQTLFGASADLQAAHEVTHFHLREETTLSWLRSGPRQWALEHGTLEAKVAPQPWGEQLTFSTPQGKASILGTEFLLASDAVSTHLAVTEGRVQLSGLSGGQTVEVAASQFTVVSEDAPAAVRPLPPKGTGTGLLGEYFAGKEFGAPTVRRFDPDVQFDWSTNRPARGLGVDHFLIRWTGLVEPQFSGRYTFELVADDGVRLWVDGQLLVDQWVLKSRQTKMRGEMALVAGRKYDLKLEYFESSGKAFVSLYWQSENQPHAIIPTSQLYPPDPKAVRPATKP